MLTSEGCKARRQRLLDRLRPTGRIVLADLLNLRYFAGCTVDPISISADYGAMLVIQPDGATKLIHDHRAPKSLEVAQVDEKIALPWYDGKTAGHGPRRLVMLPKLKEFGGRIHDGLNDPDAESLWNIIHELRRAKDADEIAQLKACMRAGEVGQAWGLKNARAGMTELDVYTGIFSEVAKFVGQASVVYGDFAVSPGPSRRGGPPTNHVLQNGEMMILDFSVILNGYRSDFTNTLVIGGQPTPDQTRLYTLCLEAMKAGEAKLQAGVPCQVVYDAVNGVFAAAGVANSFGHHAGHGLGITHPEAPFFVANSSETLVAGDVVTLEPGLYIDGIGGIRIEHNYAITDMGYEQLSQHEIRLS
jgi:Xaa-Pro dipeptidase